MLRSRRCSRATACEGSLLGQSAGSAGRDLYLHRVAQPGWRPKGADARDDPVGDGTAKIKETIALPRLVVGDLIMECDIANGQLKITKLAAGGYDVSEVQEFIGFSNQNGIALDFSKPEIVLAGKKRLEDCLIIYL